MGLYDDTLTDWNVDTFTTCGGNYNILGNDNNIIKQDDNNIPQPIIINNMNYTHNFIEKNYRLINDYCNNINIIIDFMKIDDWEENDVNLIFLFEFLKVWHYLIVSVLYMFFFDISGV